MNAFVLHSWLSQVQGGTHGSLTMMHRLGREKPQRGQTDRSRACILLGGSLITADHMHPCPQGPSALLSQGRHTVLKAVYQRVTRLAPGHGTLEPLGEPGQPYGGLINPTLRAIRTVRSSYASNQRGGGVMDACVRLTAPGARRRRPRPHAACHAWACLRVPCSCASGP